MVVPMKINDAKSECYLFIVYPPLGTIRRTPNLHRTLATLTFQACRNFVVSLGVFQRTTDRNIDDVTECLRNKTIDQYMVQINTPRCASTESLITNSQGIKLATVLWTWFRDVLENAGFLYNGNGCLSQTKVCEFRLVARVCKFLIWWEKKWWLRPDLNRGPHHYEYAWLLMFVLNQWLRWHPLHDFYSINR